MKCGLVEISACVSTRNTPIDLITVHRPTLPPVYVDSPHRTLIELPARPFAFVILHLLQRSGNGRKARAHSLRRIELVADRSVAFNDLLQQANTSPSRIHSVLIRDRTDGHPGVEIASGQYGHAVSAVLEGSDLDVEITLK